MERIIEIFRQICSIPHGSGNCEKIATYCCEFAERVGLVSLRDASNNVIVRKSGSPGREGEPALILQGHLDMVCQKEEGASVNFSEDGIQTYLDGDLMRANGTTLGADNGIAVAMILAILERNDLSHPPIEAVFTSDEEIGMIGASALDCNLLKGVRMVNLDAEEEDTLTVSCAGGIDLVCSKQTEASLSALPELTVSLHGFLGGHSGVDIHRNRENAAYFAIAFLRKMQEKYPFQLRFLCSGEKSNAIPASAKISVLTSFPSELSRFASEYLEQKQKEMKEREPNFSYEIACQSPKEVKAFSEKEGSALLRALHGEPCGVQQMSREIEGLVETSFNLGILSLCEGKIEIHYSLRSNKKEAIFSLAERLEKIGKEISTPFERMGYYPPWEFSKASSLREAYCEIYREETGKEIRVEAIHAGLECGVFADRIPGLDCISIGPNLYDIHSPREAMSLSSVNRVYQMLLKLLRKTT